MSFFRKLFSSSSAEDDRRAADVMFDAQQFAEAREAYRFATDRETFKNLTTQTALDLLRRELLG